MKTTLNIDDELLARAKAEAARQRTSVTRLIEEGLVLRLRKRNTRPAPGSSKLPVFRGRGGLRPGVDPASNRSMLDAADP